LLQLKKVTKKSRHYNVAPKNGVSIKTALSSCCEKTRKKHSDSFHRKLMMTVLFRWLVEGGREIKVKVKNKTKTKTKISMKVILVSIK
jgi:hypothetical protein